MKVSKFVWKLDDIGIEKIISPPISAAIFFFFFFEISALLDVTHGPKRQLCAISRKYDVISRK